MDEGQSGLERLQAMIDSGARPGLGGLLGIALTAVEPGRATVAGTPTRDHYNPGGSVHGAYLTALLDSACACAAQTRLPPRFGIATLELKVAFHLTVTDETGPIEAVASVLSFGRQVVFCEATLKDSADRLLATATSTLLIVR